IWAVTGPPRYVIGDILLDRIAGAAGINNVPQFVGDVDVLIGTFMKIRLPRQSHVFGQIARFHAAGNVVRLTAVFNRDRRWNAESAGSIGGLADAVGRAVDRRIEHDPADFGAGAERAAEHIAQHAAVNRTAGFRRIGPGGVARSVAFRPLIALI